MIRFLTAAAALLAFTAPLQAQTYPDRDIHVMCGYPAGSGADVYVRFFAEGLRQQSGKPVIVENKPGATGSLGAEAVARARPDGYTILITPPGAISYNQYLFKKLSYDPVKELTPVATMIRFPFFLVVDPKSPIKSVRELETHLKAKGDKASYGASAAIAIALSEILNHELKTNATRVMYRGAPESMRDLAEGSLDFLFMDPAFAIEQAKSGKIRVLAATTPQRSSALPDVPTTAEAGYPGINRTTWFGSFAPAGTPAPIVEKLNGWFAQIMRSQQAIDFFRTAGAEPFVSSVEDTGKLQREEITRWAEIVKLAKIEPQ